MISDFVHGISGLKSNIIRNVERLVPNHQLITRERKVCALLRGAAGMRELDQEEAEEDVEEDKMAKE